VLTPREPLLLGRGHHLTVDHERRGRVVEDGVDAENTHLRDPSCEFNQALAGWQFDWESRVAR
jgi:hypothetical protein